MKSFTYKMKGFTIRLRTTRKAAGLLALLCLTAAFSQAQVGIGTVTPDESAQLEIQSTEKGLLIPRMSAAQRDAISEPAEGLIVFVTDSNPGLYFYKTPGWQAVTPAPAVPDPSPGPIIPFASGTPVTLTTLLGGLVGSGAYIGFGNSVNGIDVVTGSIDLSAVGNMAFSVPRDGIITSMAGYFSTTAAISGFGTTTVSAQLYQSTTPDNTFTPVPGAVVTLAPGYTGSEPTGTAVNGLTSGLAIPVAARTRLLLVFYAATSGGALTNVISGYASAGVEIR